MRELLFIKICTYKVWLIEYDKMFNNLQIMIPLIADSQIHAKRFVIHLTSKIRSIANTFVRTYLRISITLWVGRNEAWEWNRKFIKLEKDLLTTKILFVVNKFQKLIIHGSFPVLSIYHRQKYKKTCWKEKKVLFHQEYLLHHPWS